MLMQMDTSPPPRHRRRNGNHLLHPQYLLDNLPTRRVPCTKENRHRTHRHNRRRRRTRRTRTSDLLEYSAGNIRRSTGERAPVAMAERRDGVSRRIDTDRWRRRRTSQTASHSAVCVGGAGSNLLVPGEAGNGADDVVRNKGGWHGEVAVTVGGGGLDVEEGAVLDLAGEVGAGVDSLLKEGLIPAHDEVAVISIALEKSVRVEKQYANTNSGDAVEGESYEPVGSPFERTNSPSTPTNS